MHLINHLNLIFFVGKLHGGALTRWTPRQLNHFNVKTPATALAAMHFNTFFNQLNTLFHPDIYFLNIFLNFVKENATRPSAPGLPVNFLCLQSSEFFKGTTFFGNIIRYCLQVRFCHLFLVIKTIFSFPATNEKKKKDL